MVDRKPFISAHRGNCDTPGLPVAESYKRAIDLNVDYVELDVRRTKDGVYVISHDERTPSKRYIGDLSYEEYRDEQEDQALTVSQLLTITAGRVSLHIDLKETGNEEEVVKLFLNYPNDKLIFTTLEDSSIRVIKEKFPSLNIGLSLAWRRLDDLFPGRRLRNCCADFAVVHYLLARIGVLHYCARRDIPVWVWTVDNKRDMIRFLRDPRVATLITNRPHIAIALRDEQVLS